MKDLHVAALQLNLSQGSPNNLARNLEYITQAHKAGANLIVLSELHNSPYFCKQENTDFFALAEPIPGPTTAIFQELAQKLGVVLVISLFEKRAPGIYHNTAVVLEQDGSIAGKYRKMHIPDDPGYYEKFYFTPGDLGFKPISTSLGKIGVLICWDQWFPEAARLMALNGADLLVYPTAIGFTPQDPEATKQKQLQAWITMHQAHAIANGLPVIAANRVGLESQGEVNIDFWGSSLIIASDGEILAAGDKTPEQIILQKLDLLQNEKIRRLWPYFRDRRVEFYQDLLAIYKD